MVEALAAPWDAWDAHAKAATHLIQSTMDNGLEGRGRRTPCLHRRVQLADSMQKPMQLRSSPPDHRKYQPRARCWGLVELQWNGTKLLEAETMLEWATKMTWKGRHPGVERSRTGYHKGMALGKAAMQAVEARLKRDLTLPKYDIVINPASTA